MYWAALRNYGIHTTQASIAGLLREGVAFTTEAHRAPHESGEDSGPAVLRPGVDPFAITLPRPDDVPK